MASSYIKTLVKSIFNVFRCRISSQQQRTLLLIMIAPLLSAKSLKDLSETFPSALNRLYETLDVRQPISWVFGIRRFGQERLIKHLKRLKTGDSSVRSRECVTLCADDSTRTVRGKLGNLAHPCYSGAEKRPVHGIRTRALIAVIGDGQTHFLLDVHVVPPPCSGAGRPRFTEGEWLRSSLERLDRVLKAHGLSLSSCYLSVDCAYAPGYLVAYAKEKRLRMVSEVKSSLKVSWEGMLWLPAHVYFFFIEMLHDKAFKPLGREPDIECFRHRSSIRVYGDVLVMLMKIGGETKRLFSTDMTMKNITIRRIALRRWQLEQVFWNLKQLMGLPSIHHQKRNRVLVRIYLSFLFAQAAKDSSRKLKITIRNLCRTLQRNQDLVISEIRDLCASVRVDPANEPLVAEEAA